MARKAKNPIPDTPPPEVKQSNNFGGARKGAGRPLGKPNAATLERNKVREAYRMRVLEQADRLFNAQMRLAEGCSFVYRVVRGKAVLVTKQSEIKALLDSGPPGPGSYWYITTERPDNKAIESLLDRGIGKADADDGGPVGELTQSERLAAIAAILDIARTRAAGQVDKGTDEVGTDQRAAADSAGITS